MPRPVAPTGTRRPNPGPKLQQRYGLTPLHVGQRSQIAVAKHLLVMSLYGEAGVAVRRFPSRLRGLKQGSLWQTPHLPRSSPRRCVVEKARESRKRLVIAGNVVG